MCLLNKGYLPIHFVKKGKANKKAFLSKKGKIFIQHIREDIITLIHHYGQNLEKLTEDQQKQIYLFSSADKKGLQKLTRPHFTRQINAFLSNVEFLKEKDLRITSHSFRKGYITHLWEQTKNIEFVRQVIGHSNITSTSLYVQRLEDKEIAGKIETKDDSK